MWSIDELADTAAQAIERADRDAAQEHAVRGIDSLDETALHPILADGFSRAGLGVATERHYPSPPKRRPKTSERERCDLVLLPSPELALVDPSARADERDDIAGSLFASATPADLEPEDACWIEVKATGQFAARDGVPQPNARYTTELVRAPAADIRKLARDPRLAHAAVLIVLFAADEPTARHDLAVAAHRWLDADLPVRSPVIRCVPIDDRIGNAAAAICLAPVRCGSL
ncbi:MAG: hypothetical protein AAGF47_09435 [Planctomycetota bacterium]